MSEDNKILKSNNQLPYISKAESKFSPDGHILEQKILDVRGYDLKECKKIFDEEWDNK